MADFFRSVACNGLHILQSLKKPYTVLARASVLVFLLYNDKKYASAADQESLNAHTLDMESAC